MKNIKLEKDIVNFKNQLEDAMSKGKGKFKDMMLSDYRKIMEVLDLYDKGMTKQAVNKYSNLDTEVYEKFPKSFIRFIDKYEENN